MPGMGLTIGAGIAKGAENFVNSFMQATAYENQQKMMKHQIILQALYKNLEDDNIPYNERARIFDAIPGLLGVKLDAPLSHMIGLNDLLDKDVETQSGIQATPEKKGTPASTITDERVNTQVSAEDVQLAGTINQQPTQDVPAGIGRRQVTEKFGDLSPARYKQLITSRQQDIDTEKALENYRRKAEIDFELQQDSYKAQGYNKVITEGFNANGEYVVLMGNASNDIKEVKMPKGFQPTKILAKSGSNLPAPVRAYTAYFETQINPLTGEKHTPQEAQAKALEYYKQNGDVMFGLTEAQKKATTQGAELRNTGEMPMSPAERAANADRDADREDRQAERLSIQEGILRDAQSQLAGANESLRVTEEAYNQAKSALDSWVLSNGTPEGEEGLLSGIFGKTDHSKDTKFNINGKTYYVAPEDLADDEYKVLVAEADKTRNATSALRKERDRILGNAKSAEQRINSLNSRSGGNSKVATPSITQQQVDVFRRNNANSEKVRNMTDEQIRELLGRNRNRWQP